MQDEMRGKIGTLFVVATPIGNLEDITFRAVRILREVDLVASEDTRHTRKLLAHFDIHTPLFSYYKGKEKERAARIIEKILDGQNVALVSDAGTPGISDPGAVLINEARAQGIRLVPVPGPSALATALSVAGLVETSFCFYGFIPSTRNKRRQFLSAVVFNPTRLIFYESPRRIQAFLRDCLEILGDRQVLVARELTKMHEEIISGTLSEIFDQLKNREEVRGEFVVILEGKAFEDRPRKAEIDELLVWYRDQGDLSLKDSVKKLSLDLGLSRSEIYKKALRVWENG